MERPRSPPPFRSGATSIESGAKSSGHVRTPSIRQTIAELRQSQGSPTEDELAVSAAAAAAATTSTPRQMRSVSVLGTMHKASFRSVSTPQVDASTLATEGESDDGSSTCSTEELTSPPVSLEAIIGIHANTQVEQLAADVIAADRQALLASDTSFDSATSSSTATGSTTTNGGGTLVPQGTTGTSPTRSRRSATASSSSSSSSSSTYEGLPDFQLPLSATASEQAMASASAHSYETVDLIKSDDSSLEHDRSDGSDIDEQQQRQHEEEAATLAAAAAAATMAAAAAAAPVPTVAPIASPLIRASRRGSAPAGPQFSNDAQYNAATEGGFDVSPSFIFAQLSRIPFTHEQPLELSESEALQRAIKVLDATTPTSNYKFGILYVGIGQTTEASALANSYGSPRYHKFLESMGRPIRLKDSPPGRYIGGLDRSADIDGPFAIYWHDHLTQVRINLLHSLRELALTDSTWHNEGRVSRDDHDAQLVARWPAELSQQEAAHWQRPREHHLLRGCVVQLHARLYHGTAVAAGHQLSSVPLTHDRLALAVVLLHEQGQFNFVQIIVRPLRGGRFLVEVNRKEGVPQFGPIVCRQLVSETALPTLVRETAMNAEV